MTKLSAMGRRMLVLFVLFLLFCGYLVYWLYDVQIRRHDELYQKARSKYTTVKKTVGNRGEIFDLNGNLLVGNIPCSDVCVDPSIAGDAARCREIALFLAKRLDVPAQGVYEKLMDKEFEAKQPDGTVVRKARKFAIVKARVDYEIAVRLKIEAQMLGYKTVFFRETSKRNYPKNQLLANFLGFTTFDKDRMVAVIGLEKVLDKKMQSAAGKNVFEHGRDGLPLAYGNSESVKDQDGLNVYLTIQEPIQAILEEELDRVKAETDARVVYAVMADPYTGDIIAAAQRPTFNPNDRRNIQPDAWRNRIAEDIFEPGSIVKPIVVAGALDAGVVTPETRFDCEKGFWYYGGKRLKDSHPMDILSVADIIKHSSNIGTAKVALKMGDKLVDQTLRDFGFGQRTGIPLKPETAGIYRPLKRWDTLSITRFPIGQGVGTSALQMVRSYCMLANGGRPVKLRLVDRLENPQNGEIKKFPVEIEKSVYKNPQTAKDIVDILVSVTEPGGTACKAAVRGFYTAGKTGTAQKYEKGGYSKSKYVANFIGFVPASKPRFVLLVSVDEPKGRSYYGGSVAGPPFREIAARTLKYMNVKPDFDADAREAEQKQLAKQRWIQKQREREEARTGKPAVTRQTPRKPATGPSRSFPVKKTAPANRYVPRTPAQPNGRKYRYITFSRKIDRKR
mgnify:FL=1